MTNPFEVFTKVPDSYNLSLHETFQYVFKITLDMEDEKEVVIVVDMLEDCPEMIFTEDNIYSAVTLRMNMTDVPDYVLNSVDYQPTVKLNYMFECLGRMCPANLPNDHAVLVRKLFSRIVGDIIFRRKDISHDIYNSAMGRLDSKFEQELAINAIEIISMYGQFGAIRYICSAFAIEVRECDLFETAILVSKATNIFRSMYTLNSLLQISDVDPSLCIFRSVFAKSVFPKQLDPRGDSYPYFKDYEKCFKTARGKEEEEKIIGSQLNLLFSNLYKLVKPSLKNSKTRSMLFGTLFQILKDNRKEDTLAAQNRDPLSPIEQSFCQCINLSSFMMHMIKPLLSKSIENLNIDPKWCFRDQMRFAAFVKSTTLRPVENREFRIEDEISTGFYGKNDIQSHLFWLTHWSIRLGAHSMITEMNTFLQQYIGQLRRRLTEAERTQDIGMKKQMEMAMHYVLIKIYTVKAIVSEHQYTEHSLGLFQKTLKMLYNVAIKEPECLSYVPEFIAQNINDVTGLFDRYSENLMRDSLCSEYILDTFDYCTLYMASPKYAFNPHLRKDMGPLLRACCPFDKTRRGDGAAGGAIQLAGQVRHMALNEYQNKKGLVASIIGIFCDCEYITDDDGFDYKLIFRLPFYTLLEGLWKFKSDGKSYRACVIELSQDALADMDNSPLFLRFVSLLIDDTNNMMSTGLKTLQEIRTIELKEIHQPDGLTKEQREELVNLYKRASSYVRLSEETLNLFGYMSSGIQRFFCHETLVKRCAEMANYFLNLLVGKKRKTLKVRDMKKLNFNPTQLVNSLAHLYISLADHSEWNEAVVSDERSFSMEMLRAATSILEASPIPDDQITGAKLAEAVLPLRDAVEEMESIFEEEPPDELCDPIMGTLMENPVKLPTSGQIVCRTTIARQLLSQPCDPFNRQALRLDEVIPMPELKAQIIAWKEDQRSKRNNGEKEIVSETMDIGAETE